MGAITYGIFGSHFGDMMIARSKRGICWIGFEVLRGSNPAYRGGSLERLNTLFPDAEIIRDDAALEGLKEDVLRAWENGGEVLLSLDLRGTDFQKDVWQALLNIPRGEVRSYGDIAKAVGRPAAVRAVGSAVGANPVSLIVPCHRVVQTGGGLGGYAWGVEIKAAILEAERVNKLAA